MDDPTEILEAFAKAGWGSRPMERLIEMASADATQAARLLSLAIERGGKAATFHHAALDFVPESLLPELAHQAVEAFARDSRNDVAEDTIARLSLQDGDSLRPHLARLFFELRPNERTYYASWPWRSATDADVEMLLAYLRVAPSLEEKERAFRCVLESRRLGQIGAVLEDVAADLRRTTEEYLNEVGLDGTNRWLYAEHAFHIQLPTGYVDDPSRPAWLRPANHPTWNLGGESQAHRFGGVAEGTCTVCHGTLHNLIALARLPPELRVTGRTALSLVTCLSCLGWSEPVLFFCHDSSGQPSALPAQEAQPEFPAAPLPEASAVLARTPRRWTWQDWALSNGRESLHRFGGHPTWIQSAQYPKCPGCDRLMPSLMQVDSNLPTADGGEWLWGSGGICYVFWCDVCAMSATLWQCT